MTSARAVDFSPLHERWDSGVAMHFAEKLRRRTEYAHWGLTSGALGCAIPALLLLSAFVVALALIPGDKDYWSAPEVAALVVGLAVLGFIYLSLAVYVHTSMFAGQRRLALMRLLEFCAANGYEYTPVARSTFPGKRFEGALLRDRVRMPDTGAEYGVRAMETKPGSWMGIDAGWYLAVPLDRPLPHIVLAGKGSRLDRAVDGVRVSLEGDFDRHFTLECPAGYERDALYVFTPDLMAAMIDHASGSSAEIIDDWIFFYPHIPVDRLDLAHEPFHRGMREIADTAGRRTSSRSANYRDERSSAPGLRVGAAGRRLGHVAAAAGLVLPLLVALFAFSPFIIALFE